MAGIWLGCASHPAESKLFNNSPVPVHLRPKSESTIRIKKDFGKARTFSDVLAIEKIVKLQLSDRSIIANISDIAVIDNRVLILDRKQSQLFMFDENGVFIKQVGRLGQGPGEYIKPAYITASENLFLLFDSDSRRLIFFDQEGLWVKSDDFSKSGIYPANDFLYINKRIYFPNPIYTRSNDLNLPVNLIYDTVENRVLWGFEKRFPAFFKKKPPFRIQYSAFSRVEERVWFGPPHTSEVSMYDLDGRHLKKLKPGIPDALSLDDYELASTREDFTRIWRSKYANSRIFYVRPYVLVGFAGNINVVERMSIFDVDGNILAKNFKLKNTILFANLRTTHEEHLIGVVDIDFYLKTAVDAYLTPEQKAMFVEAGWDENGHGDAEDNAYLVFFKITL